MRVLVAMSGGVDSSVAAALLVQAGHDVVGVTLRLWGGESDSGCCSVSDVDDARRVAQQLGIDHLVFNFAEDFASSVVDPYVAAHAAGRTPNPCIECNRHLKFARLSERAALLGFDAMATGHHARIAPTPGGWLAVHRGADASKDQSYVVHMLDQRELRRTMFPVGSMTKREVRAVAEDLGLRTARKPDSQDVCFIPGAAGGRQEFLARRIPLHAAVVEDGSGAVIGAVPAVELVTAGQRRGLPIGGAAARRYVVDVDVPGRRVVVGGEELLLRANIETTQVTWANEPVTGAVRVQASAHGATFLATFEDGVVHTDEPQRRIAPGQSVVFYDAGDRFVLGGAVVAA